MSNPKDNSFKSRFCNREKIKQYEIDRYLFKSTDSEVDFKQFMSKFPALKAPMIAKQILEKYEVRIMNCEEIPNSVPYKKNK